MKKYILIFMMLSSLVFGEGFQSKEERVAAIDNEIANLVNKQNNLLLLREKLLENNSDEILKGKKEEKRPKIALVLSGGGAKGAAHIGVLRVLEKYKVPVDMVIGTSIGSIIGGMYSIGYTPDEIEKTVLNLDFFSLLNNSKDRKMKNIEEKTINELYPFTVTIDKNMNLSLPMGFTSGQKIYFQLKEIFARAESIHDFDKFPMRYRAITTNLNTGKEVVLSSGDLALSAFKSMAIPSFVEPVNDKGSYYVDGGVVNNFPIEEAIKMGADIIIAVDISADATKINENSSVVTVLDKISTYNGNRNTQFQKHLADILIVPDVKNHNTLDFDNLGGLVKDGEEAAEKYAYLFKHLEFPEAYNQIHDRRLENSPVYIKDIKLTGNEILTLSKVKKLMPEVKNHEFTKEDLYLWSKKIYSIPYIEKVFYDVDGDTVTFSVVEKSGINIKAALNYTSQYGGSMNVAATVPNFGKWTKNYTLTAEVSQFPKLTMNNLSFYEFNKLKLMRTLKVGFENDPLFIYRNKDNIATYKSNRFIGEIGFATAISDKFVAGLTLGYLNNDTNYLRGERNILDFGETYQATIQKGYMFLDTLDHPYFPTKGINMYLEQFNAKVFDDGHFNGYKANLGLYYPLNKRLSLSIGGATGRITGSNIPNNQLFKIGGFRTTPKYTAFAGLPMMGVYADEFYSGYISAQYNILPSVYLVGRYNAITYGNRGLSFQGAQDIGDKWEQGYGGGIGWDTFLGPISVMMSNNLHSSAPLLEIYLGYIF
ncbi:hypothetical protein IX317_001436 [Fusobacterium sp. DD29]|uniref:patatin-like phospholipase family protein n=1 Tax=unclassified Fusobacterium TaxID=2648384 RepID=UPI001DD86549|nr:hypothetical protein [Fusobacterium sp. DD29]MBR8761983.1 hypothetical protein [Fusobacterium sp. DD25]MBR8768037.1 hypothetical protein [Fusobacterium sp. DD43]MBR8772041.1 hypothetical protein [Fusobacterium sp. DD40]MBR8776294.1 hypothetical protein [Fusobacterium sp. DD17]MBR8798556.1 hypothetical protein [Fusobacterium sp. DD12]MBR8800775.1 hypothetical protein [Fusobacterium sp. DD10]MBR8805055.1 hypothetical protein [Fusobacterium sp. DD13]MBR8812212.1 hypothetical protein [Fusoba